LWRRPSEIESLQDELLLKYANQVSVTEHFSKQVLKLISKTEQPWSLYCISVDCYTFSIPFDYFEPAI